MPHVAIVGAGITGITSAYALIRRGYAVTVVDRNRYPAMETSFANGGQLSASNAEVWNSLATIAKGVKWIFRSNAPLLVNPFPSGHKYSWLAEFCLQIKNYRANTIETTKLAIAAREQLFSIARDEGIDFDLKRLGILHLYHDRESFSKATRANRLLQEGGLERFPVTPEEMMKIEPALHGCFYGGFYTPSDSTGDIHKFTRQLANACVKKGAQLLLGKAVGSIKSGSKKLHLALSDVENGEGSEALSADAVLICAGVESRRLAAMLGDRVNIYPVKGYSITVMLDGVQQQRAAPNVSLLDDQAKIVTSRLGSDRFRVAGTAEFNGYNRDIRADRVAPLIRWCERHFPEMPTSAVVPWAGLRPMTPSMMPRVGPGRQKRVFYNTGHGHLGWTLSGATAEIMAEHVDAQFGPTGQT